jgi:hypothetical protein
MLGAYGVMPDVGEWAESAFLHELVELAPPPLLRHVWASSQILMLKGGLNDWKRISPGLDMQKIRRATDLKRKRRP